MVNIKNLTVPTENGAINIEGWLQQVSAKQKIDNIPLLRQACILTQLAGEHKATINGESCLHQGLAMAEILLELNLDAQTYAAAIVYSSTRFAGLRFEDVSEHLGINVAKLIKGTQQMDAIHHLRTATKRQASIHATTDNLRKMLLAMVDDVRVVLIKLAERVCIMRNLSIFSETERQDWARETMDIYAPLANRLGIGHLKWQLEDLSFRHLEPEKYKNISKALKERRLDREKFIEAMVQQLTQAVYDSGISKSSISGRVKHIYSIHRKMTRKRVPIGEIYDASAVRILVPSIEDCYQALSLVHGLWKHIPKEFDDYITTPKPNGYRSIHTAVVGPNDKHVEIQIRTYQMHDEAELGVAAHWIYKEGVQKQQTGYEAKIAWLREVMAWEKEVTEREEPTSEIHSQVFDDQVYVFTPKGDVIDLPNNATPLDFAYAIHSEVGHRCRGAKVNGKIAPLTYQLHTGEIVDILTGKKSQPSRDWLNPHQGYLATSRAKAKVQQWFRSQHYEENLADGQAILDKEQRRLGLKHADFSKVATKLNFKTVNDLLAALGRGDLRINAILNTLQTIMEGEKQPQQETPSIEAPKVKPSSQPTDIEVQGVGNLLTQMALCCKPIPGDAVIGYVTQGRGVTIHRQDCPNILYSAKFRKHRLINVSWGYKIKEKYPVDLIVDAYDRSGLVRDITNLLTNEKIPLQGLNYTPNRSDHTAHINLTIEVDSLAPLSRILTRIQQIPNVIAVKRQG